MSVSAKSVFFYENEVEYVCGMRTNVKTIARQLHIPRPVSSTSYKTPDGSVIGGQRKLCNGTAISKHRAGVAG
ncbi:MAG: hypothetical protein QOJ76_2069 [Acidobacteriota bacterium]|jgi:hypothetical protein|nr:hypothetical protein [Acidobacteriota bacterium]